MTQHHMRVSRLLLLLMMMMMMTVLVLVVLVVKCQCEWLKSDAVNNYHQSQQLCLIIIISTHIMTSACNVFTCLCCWLFLV